MLACFALPARSSAMAAPVEGLHYLVGTWNCTYRAGTARLDYVATYTYALNGRTLREIATWTGGGDEELQSFDTQRHGWSAVVFDDHGNATVMRATGSDPEHIAYRSVYPDANLGVKLDRISAAKYTLHGTFRSGGKTTDSVDTCLRAH